MARQSRTIHRPARPAARSFYPSRVRGRLAAQPHDPVAAQFGAARGVGRGATPRPRDRTGRDGRFHPLVGALDGVPAGGVTSTWVAIQSYARASLWTSATPRRSPSTTSPPADTAALPCNQRATLSCASDIP
jgi:hypothetical protein